MRHQFADDFCRKHQSENRQVGAATFGEFTAHAAKARGPKPRVDVSFAVFRDGIQHAIARDRSIA